MFTAVGVACRIAQGLGLHSETGRVARSPLQTEIRRRTWHGCISLDMQVQSPVILSTFATALTWNRIVSMTLGRPAMTLSLLRTIPLPSSLEADIFMTDSAANSTNSQTLSRMDFFVEHLQLCRILGDVLCRVYQSSGDKKTGSLDTILELDSQLLGYEQSLTPPLSWTVPCILEPLDEAQRLILGIQRTVLHGRYVPTAYLESMMLTRARRYQIFVRPPHASPARSHSNVRQDRRGE